MLLAALAVLAGLVILIWSADRFIDGSAALARIVGMPSLLIGMVIIGFGTSAPEMVVSALASLQGNPGIALGNAYGSNIANIALILGLTAVLSPIAIHSQVVRRELPLLILITVFSLALLWDLQLSRLNGLMLLLVFAALMGWTIFQGLRGGDRLGEELDAELASRTMSLGRALYWLSVGLVLLVASSRLLVWGAVEIATFLGVSDLIIGLTVVALGTSLPELASAIAAVRKNEHDLALGNVVGSNLFNTLAVVGIAGAIHPLAVDPELLWRDWTVMTALTLLLVLFSFARRGAGGTVSRINGGVLLLIYGAYMGWLMYSLWPPA